MRLCDIRQIQQQLLTWYKEQAEALPWRANYGERQEPYKVLVSELMLQQTRRKTVESKFCEFMSRFPDLKVLSQAQPEEVIELWAGMGYYRRAHYLHRAAQDIEQQYSGVFPEDRERLRKLSGIGDYTLAAIRSFAFRKDDRVIDGNVQRVMARFGGHNEQNIKAQQQKIKATVDALHPKGWGSEWYQGLMDLGADICGVHQTSCTKCPLSLHCQGKLLDSPISVRKRKTKVSRRKMYVFLVKDTNGRYLMERSRDRSLFRGLWTFPYCIWSKGTFDVNKYGVGAKILKGEIKHELTHLHLRIKLVVLGKDFSGLDADDNISVERTWLNCASKQSFPRWVDKILSQIEK